MKDNYLKSAAAGIVILTAAAAVVMTGGLVVKNRQNVPDVRITSSKIAAETDLPVGSVSVTEEKISPVNINTADKDELMSLKGIGEKTALAIIEYREKTPFMTVDDLLNVSGIGEKKLSEIRDEICV